MSEQKGLDRPELREKIDHIYAREGKLRMDNGKITLTDKGWEELLALIPDEEDELRVVGLIRKQERKRIFKIITEDFVEMIGNLYMDDKNRQIAYELWGRIKKQALKEEK